MSTRSHLDKRPVQASAALANVLIAEARDLPVPAAPPQPTRTFSRDHRAIVVLDRNRPTLGRSALPSGWNTVFANARVADLLEHLFAEAGIDWAASVLPEVEQAAADAAEPTGPAHPTLVTYNGRLTISPQAASFPAGQGLVLIVNGHHFPLCDLRSALELHRQGDVDATFFDFRQPAGHGYDEQLHVRDGWVQRVARLYTPAISPSREERRWPALIVLSASAARQLLDIDLPQQLENWPSILLRAGLAVRGASLTGRLFDLHERNDIHELADAILRFRGQWIRDAGRLVERSHRVWVGKDVAIDPTAELIGPIAIGDQVSIGANAVIVGPAVIGRGSRIESGMVLRRCLVQPSSILGSEAVCSPGLSRSAAPIERPIRIQQVIEAARTRRLGTFRHYAYCSIKRGIDIAGSLLFILFTLSFYPLIALGIYLNSPGTIFYGHMRQGRGGRLFKCWKFRTMIPNAEKLKQELLARNEVDGPQFKIKDDPRVFAVGRVLRKFNIDEWPQFFNVLFGHMSLVGPRPSPEKENQMCPAWRDARLSVRPGITGLWQVSRCRDGETDFQEWIYYDVQYVKKQSILLDLKIILKTFKVMLKGS